MSSMKETSTDSCENSGLSNVQQLVFSVGHLKLSLRALSSMHLQSALHSQKDTEPPSQFSPLESNTLLENMINEVLSHKSEQNNPSTGACKVDEAPQYISIDDLELVQIKLQEELEKRRHHFITSLSSKMKQ